MELPKKQRLIDYSISQMGL